MSRALITPFFLQVSLGANANPCDPVAGVADGDVGKRFVSVSSLFKARIGQDDALESFQTRGSRSEESLYSLIYGGVDRRATVRYESKIALCRLPFGLSFAASQSGVR